MKETKTISGQKLREMMATATSWLEKSARDIDALNVFPVPDGDTGTNMMLTMRSSMEEAFRAPDHSAAAVAKAIAKGSLTGARGNSGVILSQIWRGLAHSLDEKEEFDGVDLADALVESAKAAYRGISDPVEGTILTVIREAAAAAKKQAACDEDPALVLGAAVDAARESVANTPNLLPVLREAGVVDAGGQGIFTILEGSLRYLRGEVEQMQFAKPQIIVSESVLPAKMPRMRTEDEVPYGYCTEFLIKGEGLEPDKISPKLQKKGQSLIVVGDETNVRVHIHTLEPGNIIHYASSLGTLHNISIRNMDEQHQDYLEMQKEKKPVVNIATVAVANGEGLTDVFSSLGAVVVPGGQTMNPSTKDLLQGVEKAASDKVIILPNNKNIILTAQQVQSLTEKTVAVIPTQTIPQGVAALLALDYEADLETNAQLMKEALSMVRTVEITRAVRPSKIGKFNIKKKQAIGFLDGGLVASGASPTEVLDKILGKLDLERAEVITLYYGADTEAAEAKQVAASIRERYPHLQVDVLQGGQPHYNYIMSIE